MQAEGNAPSTTELSALALASRTHLRILEDWVGLEPTMLYSRLKVCAVRHYGNQSLYVAYDLTQTISFDLRLWLYTSNLAPKIGLEPIAA